MLLPLQTIQMGEDLRLQQVIMDQMQTLHQQMKPIQMLLKKVSETQEEDIETLILAVRLVKVVVSNVMNNYHNVKIVLEQD